MNPDLAVEQMMARAAEVNAAIDRVRGSGSAADGRVRVEVDADGKIMDITVASSEPTLLGEALIRAITEAQHGACSVAKAAVSALESELSQEPYVQAAAASAFEPRTAPPVQYEPEYIAEREPNWLDERGGSLENSRRMPTKRR